MGKLVAVSVLACTAQLLLLAPAARAERPPDATTGEVTEITGDAATLTGTVTPWGSETTYRFRYGTTEPDSETAAGSAGSGNEPVAVSTRVTGLAPDTVYRVRLHATGPRKDATGGEVTFRTAATPSSDPVAEPEPAPGMALTPLSPGSTAFGAPAPVFGERVNVTVRQGEVSVSTDGQPAVVINGFASVPVGSRLNTREGSVNITSALPGGGTQTGIFHGGLFDIQQPKDEGGMTAMVLRGRPLGCRVTPPRSAAASILWRKRPRSLWGNVRRGKFRIRGGNSVASVRGTIWYVEDRCDGTLTRVRRGSVRVRDLRRNRTVVVRAGQRYLARLGR